MLGPFQKTATMVAIGVLVFALIFVAIMLVVEANNPGKFPPYSSTCPDYWNMEQNKNGKDVCVNNNNLGKIQNKGCRQMQPDNSIFSGDAGECNKYKYAKACTITWDGITNSQDLKNNC